MSKPEIKELVAPSSKLLDKQDSKVLSQAIKKTKSPNEIAIIEQQTSNYVADVFNMVRDRAKFLGKIEEALLEKIDELSPSQLIALAGNTQVNVNDQINKALAPTSQLLTEKQRTEQAQAQAFAQTATAVGDGQAMKSLAEDSGQEILTGLKILGDMVQQANKMADKSIIVSNAEDQEIVDGDQS